MKQITNTENKDELTLLTKRDKEGKPAQYKLKELRGDQKQIMAHVIKHSKRCLACSNDCETKTLRLTVKGVTESDKSTFINTLIIIIRKMFKANDAVHVFASTECAAFNAEGQTMSREMRTLRVLTTGAMTQDRKEFLIDKLLDTVATVIDERSMLSALNFEDMCHAVNESMLKHRNSRKLKKK